MCLIMLLGVAAVLAYMAVTASRAVEKTTSANAVVESVFEMVTLVNDYRMGMELRARDQWLEKHKSFSLLLDSMENGKDERATLLKSIVAKNIETQGLFSQLVSVSERRRLGASSVYASDEYERIVLGQLQVKLSDMVSDVVRFAQISKQTADSQMWASVLGVGSLLLLVAIIFGVFSFRVIGSMVTRVADVKEGADRIAGGQLDHRIPVGHVNDEVGQLASSFNAMVQRLELSLSELEEEVEERNAVEMRLEEHLEGLKHLIVVASHELRHPATIFKGYSAILLTHRSKLSEEEFEDALLAIDAASDRLVSMTTKLLETARIEGNISNIERGPAMPCDIVTRSVDEMRVRGCDHPFNIKTNVKSDCYLIDQQRIQDTLIIILDNAAKFSPAGLEIDVCCEEQDGELVFSVADRGPGVPEKDRERVFERFYQVENTINHSKPGIGLGLFIARTYVEAHDGWIEVLAREGGGAVFRFGIPDSTCHEHRHAV